MERRAYHRARLSWCGLSVGWVVVSQLHRQIFMLTERATDRREKMKRNHGGVVHHEGPEERRNGDASERAGGRCPRWSELSLRRQMRITFGGLALVVMVCVVGISVAVAVVLGSTAEEQGQDAVEANAEQNLQLASSEFTGWVEQRLSHGANTARAVAAEATSLFSDDDPLPVDSLTATAAAFAPTPFLFDEDTDRAVFHLDLQAQFPDSGPVPRTLDPAKNASLETPTFSVPGVENSASLSTDDQRVVGRLPFLTTMIRETYRGLTDATEILVAFDTSGIQLRFPGAVQAPASYDPRNEVWYTAAVQERGRVVASEPFKDAVSGTMLMSFSRSFALRRGDILGVVKVEISLQQVAEILKQQRIQETGFLSLIATGTTHVIAHPLLEESQDLEIPQLAEVDPAFARDGAGLATLRDVIRGSSGFRVVRGVGDRWVGVQANTKLSNEFGMVLLASVDESEIFDPLKALEDEVDELRLSIVISNVVIGVVAVVVTFLLIGRLTHKITQPLKHIKHLSNGILQTQTQTENEEQLVEMQQRMENSVESLDEYAAANADDEIGRLSREFVRLWHGLNARSNARTEVSDVITGINPFLFASDPRDAGTGFDHEIVEDWINRRKDHRDEQAALIQRDEVAVTVQDEARTETGSESIYKGLRFQLLKTVLLPLGLGTLLCVAVSLALLLTSTPEWMDGTSAALLDATTASISRASSTKAAFTGAMLRNAETDVRVLSSRLLELLGPGREDVVRVPPVFSTLARTSASTLGNPGLSDDRVRSCDAAGSSFPCQSRPPAFGQDPFQRFDQPVSYAASSYFEKDLLDRPQSEGGAADGNCSVVEPACAARETAALDSHMRSVYLGNDLYRLIFFGMENQLFRAFPYLDGSQLATNEYTSPCTGERATGYDPRLRGWYCRSMGQARGERAAEFAAGEFVFTSDPYVGALTGDFLMTIARPFDDSTSTGGVISINMDAQEVKDSVDRTKILQRGFAVLSRGAEVLIGDPLPPSEELAAFVRNVAGAAADEDPLVTNQVETLTFQSAGEEWFASAAPVPGTEMKVVVMAPRSDAEAAAREVEDAINTSVIIVAVSYAVVLALVAAFTFWAVQRFGRRVASPIFQLSQAISQLQTSINAVEFNQENTCKEVKALNRAFKSLSTGVKMGMTDFDDGNFDASFAAFQETMSQFASMENRAGEIVCLANMGKIRHKQWRHTLQLELRSRPGTARKLDAQTPALETLFEDARTNFQQSIDRTERYLVHGQDDSRSLTAKRLHDLLLLLVDLPRLVELSSPALIMHENEMMDRFAEMEAADQHTKDFVRRAQRAAVKAKIYESLGRSDEAHRWFDDLIKAVKRGRVTPESLPAPKLSPSADEIRAASVQLMILLVESLHRAGDLERAAEKSIDVLTHEPKLSEAAWTRLLGVLFRPNGDPRMNELADETRKTKKSVILLIDTSRSMEGARINSAFDGAMAIMRNAIKEEDLCGLSLFDDNLNPVWEPCRIQANIEDYIRRATLRRNAIGRRTRFFLSVRESISPLVRVSNAEQYHKFIVVLTDGEDNIGGLDAPALSQQLVDRGVSICLIAVSISNASYRTRLRQDLVDPVNRAEGLFGFMFDVDDVAGITSAFQEINRIFDHIEDISLESASFW
ncbi:Methyl-accepting chemotaxis protein TlpB [Durusdinium trenchii]|uniref:Methyl-accepting chemotaxis protein TlpB n=1 Tax=Durusdinium trenchii TaxID=1381693 RepID=A0ABP0RLE4_9DINO